MDSFKELVLQFICAIPEGKVATYGQIAALAGSPRAARQVGYILHDSAAKDIPWQRVINANGGLSTYKLGHGELQKALLEKEGIRFNKDDLVNLDKYQWQPEPKNEQGSLF